jgi:hypothetical protein
VSNLSDTPQKVLLLNPATRGFEFIHDDDRLGKKPLNCLALFLSQRVEPKWRHETHSSSIEILQLLTFQGSIGASRPFIPRNNLNSTTETKLSFPSTFTINKMPQYFSQSNNPHTLHQSTILPSTVYSEIHFRFVLPTSSSIFFFF